MQAAILASLGDSSFAEDFTTDVNWIHQETNSSTVEDIYLFMEKKPVFSTLSIQKGLSCLNVWKGAVASLGIRLFSWSH